MSSISSYEKLEDFGRIRLSQHFFMRDFLHSEIAAWHGLRNVPDFPDKAVYVGKMLCERLLEPLQDTFGRIHVRSGYRSPEVNRLGNENRLNCASNEANFAHHIWDYPDADGKRGATACIVVPWLVDHMAKGGSWTSMAWWIHDHLPYSSLYFFSRLGAFNINWHETPVRHIDSYASPKGCLTRPGMSNHAGSHSQLYGGFPSLRQVKSGLKLDHPPSDTSPSSTTTNKPNIDGGTLLQKPVPTGTSGVTRSTSNASVVSGRRKTATHAESRPFKAQTGGVIHYRAIHTKNIWRKVSSHKSLENAILGRDGAVGLFARKVRISYETHGDPLYVLVWESGALNGYVVKADANTSNGIQIADVPMRDMLEFEARSRASQRELEKYFGS